MYSVNQDLLELFQQGISIFDKDLNLVRCNSRYLDLLNFPRELGEPGTPIEAFFRYNAKRGEYGAGNHDDLVNERLELARQQEPHVFERERPDGTVLLIQGSPTDDGGFLTTYSDITELRRTEEILRDDNRALEEEINQQDAELRELAEDMRRKNAFLQETVENLSHGISFFDRDLKLVVANSSFFDVMDFPKDKLGAPGTPFEDFLKFNIERGEYGEGDPEEIAKTALERARQFQPHEFRRSRPDGTVLEVIGKPIPQGFVTTYRDVTSEQHSLDALKADTEFLREKVEDNLDEMGRTYALLQNVLDTIPVRVFWKDHDLKYVGGNRLFLKDCNLDSLSDLKGRSDYDMPWANTYADRFRKIDLKILETGEPVSRQEEMRYRSNGLASWFRTTKVPMRDIAGNVIGVIGIYEDITDEKSRQADLRESETRFRAIFDQTFQFIGLLDPDGKILEMNQAATTGFNFRSDEYIGRQFEDTPFWTHTDSERDKVMDAMNRAREGEFVRFNTFYQEPGGKPVYLDFSLKPVYDDQGQIHLLLPEARDITEIVLSQRKAHQSEQWRDALFNHTPLGVLQWDLDHNIAFSNAAANRIFGYGENGMTGLHAAVIVEDIVKPVIDDVFRDLEQNTGGFRSENRNVTADGRVIICDWYNTPLLDDDGNVFGIASFIDDITERVQTRRELETSEERYGLALQGVKDGIFDWNLDTNEVFLSDIAATILEVDSEDGYYSHLVTLGQLPQDEQDRLRNEITLHLQGKTAFLEAETQMRPEGQNEKWVLVRGVAKPDSEGVCHRMSGSVNDITQRKIAERKVLELNETLEERVEERTRELRKTNDKLSETLEELGQTQDELIQSEKMASLGGLVSGVAHEVNTPIGVGVTATSALIEDMERLEQAFHNGTLKKSDFERFFAEARPGSKIILDNLQRAAELIKSFKKVAVDQSTDSLRDLNIGEYLGEVVTSLKPNLRKKGVRVETAFASDIIYKTDPGAIAQIITNLAMNSVSHAWPTGKGGNIYLGVKQDDDGIRIQYKDDGDGMDEEVQQKIFEPFFTTKRGDGGSGLGMNITYNLVTQRLGGKISCSSLPGRGAMFDICLPMEKSGTI